LATKPSEKPQCDIEAQIKPAIVRYYQGRPPGARTVRQPNMDVAGRVADYDASAIDSLPVGQDWAKLGRIDRREGVIAGWRMRDDHRPGRNFGSPQNHRSLGW
jgi:hypothetical protein